MIVAVPVSEQKMESSVCPAFGRSEYFLVYNTEIKEGDFIDNPAAESQGGAGIKAAQVIVDLKVDVLLTPRLGQNAADVLQGERIKLYKTTDESIQQNIDSYLEGNLKELTEIHAGFHNHGGQ